MTLDDISREFCVSRRTAERLRDAVEAVFGPLQMVDSDDRRHHWRLKSGALRPLIQISPEEMAEVESAAESLDRTGLVERAVVLRELAGKLRALRRSPTAEEFDADLEALMQAEGTRHARRPQTASRGGFALSAARCHQGEMHGGIRVGVPTVTEQNRTLRAALGTA